MADEASAILLLMCSHEVWVKVTYDWSTALCLCLCLCRPSFHLSKLQHKLEHKRKLVRFSCPYAYVDPGCVRLGNVDLDLKIRISDLISNAKSENGFQR